MRKFVKDGPTIPFPVLQAHEEERLVFFCGAGISFYTGLPSFKNLVQETFKNCGHPLSETGGDNKNPEDLAFHANHLDQALHLLEQKVGRKVARARVIEILSKPLRRGSSHLRLHKALLDLAGMRDGGTRLVTTNFDNRFSKAIPKTKLIAEAPRLGWPRVGAWRHLTYLHGRIDPSDPEGEDLILSSGDFGRAYLTEGWASRFLVELFRDYTVLFVGYSLNDPVLRYMVDALATDMRDGRFRSPFVLAPFRNGDLESQVEAWEAKGVEPIPFSTGTDGKDYSRQDETLAVWAEHHMGGLDSRIAVATGPTRRPYIKTPEDDDLHNVAWALSKEDGSVARAFADFDPLPDISWLKPLGSLELPGEPGKVDVGLVKLPSPPTRRGDKEGYHIAPLSGAGAACLPGLPLNVVTRHLGRWLARHRESQDLVDWVTEHRCIVHPTWQHFLANEIDNVAEPWRSFWQLIIDGSTQPPCDMHRTDYFAARRSVRRGEWLPTVDRALMHAGRSWVRGEKPYSFTGRDRPPESLDHVARFRLEIADHDLLWDALSHSDSDEVRNAFSKLADPLTSHLASALELAERAQVFDATLYTHGSIPSVNERPDDRPLRDWTCLVYLVVEAFKCLHEHQPLQAHTLAARWRDLFTMQGLHLFRRLAVFAMADILTVSSSTATDFLLGNHAEVLWDMDTRSEVDRFIRRRASNLGADDQERLGAAVAAGPRRDLFPGFEGTDGEFDEIANSLRIEKSASLLEAGLPVPDDLRTEAREELDVRRRVGERPPPRATAGWVQPSTADELLSLNSTEICDLLLQRDGWHAGHQLADLLKQNLDLGVRVLQGLTGMEVSGDVWEIGFRTLNELEELAEKQRIVQVLLRLAADHPDWISGPGVRPVSRFLASFEEAMEAEQEEALLGLWDIAFAAAEMNGATAIAGDVEPVEEAINAPSGDLATALLHRLFSRNFNIGSGLPDDLAPRFNMLWEGESPAHQFARVVLASRVLWLHRLDPEWTQRTILVGMATDTDETLGLWAAMLWPGQWDVELVSALEGGIPIVLRRRDRASEEFCGRFSEWIASILLEAPDSLTEATKSSFFGNASPEMLARAAWVFGSALENAGDRSARLWEERLRPVLEEFWPADLDKKSTASSGALLRMSLAVREKFPNVIETLNRKNLIVPGSADDFILHLDQPADEGQAYDYGSHHPEAVLTALDRSADANLAEWNWAYVEAFLNRLVAETNIRANDPRVVRLRQIMARG